MKMFFLPPFIFFWAIKPFRRRPGRTSASARFAPKNELSRYPPAAGASESRPHILPGCAGGAVAGRISYPSIRNARKRRQQGRGMTRAIGFAGTVGAAALFLAAWTGAAQADFTQEVRRCDFGGGHPDIRIVACTRNIGSGRFTGRNLAVAFSNRGLAYKKKGQWDKAIGDYDEAIRLKPDFAFALNNRGNAYYGKGHFDRAIDDYDEAIRLQPDFAEAFGNRGNVYRKRGQLARAIEDYNKAIGLNPDDAKVFADRGLAYEKKGEPTQALRDYKKAHAMGFRHSLLLKKLREGGEFL